MVVYVGGDVLIADGTVNTPRLPPSIYYCIPLERTCMGHNRDGCEYTELYSEHCSIVAMVINCS